jgi:YbgC/YbaW family acyl-CoA thioester hydrolase
MFYKYDIVIKEQHLDSYGHVNNATYLSLYEEARWEAITAGGYGYEKVHETGLGPIVLGIDIKFLKELKLREVITVTLEMISYENKIFKMKQQMLKASGQVASEMILTGSFFDLKNRKIILPNEAWLKAMGM